MSTTVLGKGNGGTKRGSTSSTPHRSTAVTPAKTKKKTTWLLIFLIALLTVWICTTWGLSIFVWGKSNFNTLQESFPTTNNDHPASGFHPSKNVPNDKDNHHVLVAKYLLGYPTNLDARNILPLLEMTMKQVQDYLNKKVGRKTLPLMAYLEPPLPPYDETKTPRLSRRTHNRPEDLEVITYSDILHTCSDLPNDFPVLVPKDDNDCPVQKDPFLPWIHDAFVSQDSTTVEFVAHNQRRCNTDPKYYYDRLSHLEPQVTLMQSVPVQRIRKSAMELVKDNEKEPWKRTHQSAQYKLTSLEQADEDGKETRFLCQFHTQLLLPPNDDNNNGRPILQKVLLGETLSTYRYNYEHANYQKYTSHPMLTRPADKDDTKNSIHNEQVWNSLLHFSCPIPVPLQSLFLLANSNSGLSSSPFYYVDVVPIRTYPRTDKTGYFDRTARNLSSTGVTFDPNLEWGPDHVLPPIMASGRWANIPLCPILPPQIKEDGNNKHDDSSQQVVIRNDSDKQLQIVHKQHYLVACVWASASFTTRGSSDPDTSTSDRLLEWMTYQLYMAGFDHIYIYDNSKGDLTLEPIITLFPASKVTRIPWKHPVCNNNRPGHANQGERSSQYAAETSCRLRYGPLTKWMAVLDTDEYFIPQEPYPSIRQWLEQKYDNDDNPTKILSFFQTRAIPNMEYMDPVPSSDKKDPQSAWKKKESSTYLETYNCDRVPFPKPGWSWRAKKQIFQPSYVLHHFVHYSLVTKRLLDAPSEASQPYTNRAPLEHRVDEEKEAFMLHTKTTSPDATLGWRRACQANQNNKKDDKNNCPIGIPFPPTGTEEGSANADGLVYNCYVHDRIVKEFAPKLKDLLVPLQQKRRQNKRR